MCWEVEDMGQSTIALFDAKQKEDLYVKKLEKGKVELQKLKSMNNEQLVSKKDLMIEKERKEMDAQQEVIAAERRAKEEKERLEREERQALIEEQRQRAKEKRELQKSKSDGVSSGGGGAFTTIGVIGALGAAAFVALSGKEKEVVTNDESSLPKNETISVSPSNNETMVDLSIDPSTIDPQQNGDEQILQPLTDINKPSSLYDNISPTTTVEMKTQAAEEAMNNYLDEDDGGEAWLQVMQELMGEEEEEEGAEDETNDS